MEVWIPNTPSAEEQLKNYKTIAEQSVEETQELILLLNKLITAVKYYRSPMITKDQYKELQELNKFFDDYGVLEDNHNCCDGSDH